MDMKINELPVKGELRFSLTGTCPHCDAPAVFQMVTSLHKENNRACAGMRCPGCNGYILGIVSSQEQHGRWRYETHYPMGRPNDTVDPEIPKEIADDFQEALRCQWVNAHNATAEMCRRAIEASCDDLGAPQGNIQPKIDWMAEQGKITEPLKEMAHKIRLGGNRGAHPSPRVIDKDDAEAIVSFCREYFHHVYVMPALLKKFDFSKKAKTAATGGP